MPVICWQKKKNKKKKALQKDCPRATRISLSCRPTKPQFLSGVSRISTGCFVIVARSPRHLLCIREGEMHSRGTRFQQNFPADNIRSKYFDSGNGDASETR